MNPGRAGRRRRWKTRTTTSEAPKITARSRRTSSCSMAPLRYRNRIPGQYGNSFCDKVFRRCDGAHTWRVVRPAALAAWRRDRWAALSWAFLPSPALEAAPGRESQRHQDPPTRRRRPPRRAHPHGRDAARDGASAGGGGASRPAGVGRGAGLGADRRRGRPRGPGARGRFFVRARAARTEPHPGVAGRGGGAGGRSEEHTSELQSLAYLVCRLLLEKKKKK